MIASASISSLGSLASALSLVMALTAVQGADSEIQRLSSAEQNAVAALQKLGAIVRVVTKKDKTAKDTDDETKPPPAVMVIIAKDWTGDDSDLKHARTLSTLQHLYVIGEAKVTDEALDRLRTACPRANISRRAAVRLGIAVDPTNRDVAISRVELNSPAERAGFRRGDTLVKFAGEPVKNFEELVHLMLPMSIGQKADVEFLRDGNTISTTVEFTTEPPQE